MAISLNLTEIYFNSARQKRERQFSLPVEKIEILNVKPVLGGSLHVAGVQSEMKIRWNETGIERTYYLADPASDVHFPSAQRA